ncbi:site-specific integrase [Fusibacillus kribbianus]|uniref:Tyrosine-type recombinase/integrase n=1 Tax=Fusibacillus kribbianus TaxID=3044208 RepID=A0AAP4EYK2_9FIRM|nr:site-specific integrase [Ruminococcus sp. YH-rum2234]MDI9241901.1 tyrosine-type recombinase/integrase [Ruminococcus sp. YH-rum2234]
MGKDLKGKELGKGFSQRRDGRYMARAMVDGETIAIYGFNLKELKKKLPVLVNEVKVRQLLPVRRGSIVTVNEWYEEWFNTYKAPNLKHGKDGSYKRTFINTFGKYIGMKYLSDVIQMDIQAAIADLFDQGRSSRYIRTGLGITRQCFDAAVGNGMITNNPTMGVTVMKGKTAERRVLTQKEQKLFLDYLERTQNWYKEMYQFMLVTGMRIGEIGALRWEDIDFNSKIIHVQRSLSYMRNHETGKSEYKIMSPKTENSKRRIPFFGETEAILKSQRKKAEKQKKEKGYLWRENDEFGNLVFVTRLGSPVGRHIAEKELRHISDDIRQYLLYERALDDPITFENVHPHALRHTFATRCFEKNMPPKLVQDLMGHENYSTTVTYTHVTDDTIRKAVEQYKDFLNV